MELGQVSQGDSVLVSLWHLAGEARFSARCHLWCTEDGQMPRAPTEVEEEEEDMMGTEEMADEAVNSTQASYIFQFNINFGYIFFS